MKSNFEFLNKYWPALAQIADTAEKICIQILMLVCTS